MKIAYFDCPFGAAGDMLTGALLGAGLDQDRWLAELSRLSLPADSYRLSIRDVLSASVASKRVEVEVTGQDCERGLPEVRGILAGSEISTPARRMATRIFERLASAEARVHGCAPEDVHFHEVGAIDAIVDIAGFAIAYDLLGIEECSVSPLPLGRGSVMTEHGVMPVPAPAVLNLLSEAGAPTSTSSMDYECLTPTGAAILCQIASSWGSLPDMQSILAVGYGAGEKDGLAWPNVSRVVIGQAPASGLEGCFHRQQIQVLECNLDDISPQILSYVVERLFAASALDVFITPVLMKKGRCGHLLTVLCRPEDEVALQELVLRETTSLGVRSYPASRLVAGRQWVEVELSSGGVVRVKVARDSSGAIINMQPEYEDCASYATAYNVPLSDVMLEARTACKRASSG